MDALRNWINFAFTDKKYYNLLMFRDRLYLTFKWMRVAQVSYSCLACKNKTRDSSTRKGQEQDFSQETTFLLSPGNFEISNKKYVINK